MIGYYVLCHLFDLKCFYKPFVLPVYTYNSTALLLSQWRWFQQGGMGTISL